MNFLDFTHLHPEMIVNHSNGDVAANSYEYYEDDIKYIHSMGVSNEQSFFNHTNTLNRCALILICCIDESLQIFNIMAAGVARR